MTTNLRKSFSSLFLVLSGAVLVSLFAVACGGGHKGDGVWIPLPKDTSELGVRDHYMNRDSIRIYRKRYEEIRDTLAHRDSALWIPLAEAFNKKSVIDIMKDSNCVGLRIYYGATSPSKKTGKQEFRLILVGVDKKGNDLFVRRGSPLAAQDSGDGDGGFEYGQCTPPCYGDGDGGH